MLRNKKKMFPWICWKDKKPMKLMCICTILSTERSAATCLNCFANSRCNILIKLKLIICCSGNDTFPRGHFPQLRIRDKDSTGLFTSYLCLSIRKEERRDNFQLSGPHSGWLSASADKAPTPVKTSSNQAAVAAAIPPDGGLMAQELTGWTHCGSVCVYIQILRHTAVKSLHLNVKLI